jgi:DNA-binding CsgD family transcriptional regulator
MGIRARVTPMPIFPDLDELTALASPTAILQRLQLHAKHFGLNIYGAWRIPWQPEDYQNGYPVGESVFIHPDGRTHYDQHMVKARKFGPNLLSRMSWVRRAPFTVTECLRLTRPNEDERWVFNLLRAHGIRDMLYCPIDDWIVVFWSPKVVRLRLVDRGRLYVVAMHAKMRLDEIVEPMKRDQFVRLSSRETAVLQFLSMGENDAAIAGHLGVAEPTIRTYVDRAMTKLGAKTRPQAVAEALRRLLVK